MQAKPVTREGLRIAIGLPGAIMLVVGGVIGVGIFVNPAVTARFLHTPALVLTAWALGGLIALLGALIYAELGARMPSTGGEYVYLRTTYGPLAGFLFGWTTLLVVQAGGMAAVAIVFAANMNVLAGGALPERAVVIAVLGTLTLINCLGVRAGNGVQGVLGALKIAALAALIAAGLWVLPATPRQAAIMIPPDTWKGFGAAMIPVVFSYGGWQTANYVAGEMKNPARTLARALIAGVLAVIAIYLLVNIACLHSLGIAALGATLTPASDVLQRAVGPAGARLAATASGLSALGYLSQGMLTGPRVFFAMARDGLFFQSLARVSPTTHVPVAAILLQGVWTTILALTGSYEQILSYVIAINVLFFGLSASCLFILRRRPGPAPNFVAPLHPYSTAAFVLACALIVMCSFWSFPLNSLIGYAIMAAGIPPYLYWRRQLATGNIP
jgi:APA family basic amino acid/polyamine antiporter